MCQRVRSPTCFPANLNHSSVSCIHTCAACRDLHRHCRFDSHAGAAAAHCHGNFYPYQRRTGHSYPYTRFLENFQRFNTENPIPNPG